MTKRPTKELILDTLDQGDLEVDVHLARIVTGVRILGLLALVVTVLFLVDISAWRLSQWLILLVAFFFASAVVYVTQQIVDGRRRERFQEKVESLRQELDEDLALRRLVETALRERTQSVLLLQRIAVAANDAADQKEALHSCLGSICSITDWPIGHAFIVSPETGNLVATDLWHFQFEESSVLLSDLRDRPGAGLWELPRRVRESGRPAWVTDVAKDRGRLDELARYGIASAFAFPVVIGLEVVAVLQFFSLSKIEFDPGLLDLMTHLGVQLGRVTERQRAQRTLSSSEQRYESLAKVSPVAIYQTDAEGRCLYVNDRWCELSGRDVESALGEGWIQAFHPGDLAELALKPREALATLRHLRELRLLRPDGSLLWVVSQIDAETDEEGHVLGYVGTLTDITHRKEEEEERWRLEAQVFQAQKLESLGLLAGGIAHDFNNLLMGILGNAGLAQMELPPGSPTRVLIQEIETASQRAAELAHQMLAYSGKSTILVEAIDLNHVVEEILHLLEAAIPKKASLHFEFNQDLPAIEGDVTQIRQVVMNLITNAADALSEEGGDVHLRTMTVVAEEEYFVDAQVGENSPDGRYVLLEVNDTGRGMDRATVSKIFDPFFTTKATGRGLGMATVLGIVRGHQGAIKVESEPGQGTTFRVYFAASGEMMDSPVEPATAEVRQAKLATWRGKGKVLVVDDEEMVRRLAERILQRFGFEAILAKNGRHALEVYEEHRGSLLAILLDMTMPELDGVETLQALRKQDVKIPVIFSSGYTEQEAVHRLVEDPLVFYIQKPYKPSALVSLLRTLVEE